MKRIEKESMGFADGMLYGMGFPNTGFKQVDWIRAKEIIEVHKKDIVSVSAGLAEDWDYTSGEVWNSVEGYIKQEDTYVYACSKWATPALEIEYKDGTEKTIECWIDGDDSSSYFDLSDI